MRAMVLTHPHPITSKPLKLTEIPLPQPGPQDVRIKIKICGVCHTDLHIIEGDLPMHQHPLVPGHEIIGKVDTCGNGVTDFKVDERVGVGWLYSTCNSPSCRFCSRNQENLCDSCRFTGYDVQGGYTEYIVAPAAFISRVPEALTDQQAAPLMCAGIIGYRAFRIAEIHKGDRVGLFGFGASAHIVLQILTHLDCTVAVFTRSKNHQALALQMGADWVGDSTTLPPFRLDRAISFTPVGSTVKDILQHMEKGGILAINAIHLTDIPSIPWHLIYHERQIRSVTNMTRQDAYEFLQLATQIPIETKTITYQLEEANEALEDLKASRINGAAILTLP